MRLLYGLHGLVLSFVCMGLLFAQEMGDQTGATAINDSGCSGKVSAPSVVCANAPYEVVVQLTSDEPDAQGSVTVSLTDGSVIIAVNGESVGGDEGLSKYDQPCPSTKTYTVDPKGNYGKSRVLLGRELAATTDRHLIEGYEISNSAHRGRNQILPGSRLYLKALLKPFQPIAFDVAWSHDRGGQFSRNNVRNANTRYTAPNGLTPNGSDDKLKVSYGPCDYDEILNVVAPKSATVDSQPVVIYIVVRYGYAQNYNIDGGGPDGGNVFNFPLVSQLGTEVGTNTTIQNGTVIMVKETLPWNFAPNMASWKTAIEGANTSTEWRALATPEQRQRGLLQDRINNPALNMGELWNNGLPKHSAGTVLVGMTAHAWDTSVNGTHQIQNNITKSTYELKIASNHPDGVNSLEEFKSSVPSGAVEATRLGTIGSGDPFLVLRFAYTPGVPGSGGN